MTGQEQKNTETENKVTNEKPELTKSQTEASADARYAQKLNALNETTVGKYLVSDLSEVVSGRYLKPPDDVKNDSGLKSMGRELTNATMSLGADVLIASEEGVKGIGRLGKAVGKEMLHPWELMVKAGKVTMSPIDSTKRAGKAIAEFGSTLAEDTKSAWKNSPAAGRGGAALAMAVRTVTGAQALKASQIGQKLGKAIDKTKVGQVSKSTTASTIKDIPQTANTPFKAVTTAPKTPSNLNRATTAVINTANVSRLTNRGNENLPKGPEQLSDEIWNTQTENWKERLPEQVTEVLKKQKSMQLTKLASQSDMPVSLYYPKSQAQIIESLKPEIEQTEAEFQKLFHEHFPDMKPVNSINNPKVVFAEGLGNMEHKASGDMAFLDTAELSAGESEKVVETVAHERTHQMMEFYLADKLGKVENLWMTEGFANIMPELLRAQKEGLDYQSYAQEFRDESGIGEDVSNGMSLEEAISQREKVDKFGEWNYEYGQAFVKSFVARHGLKEYFRMYQEMGKNPEKYGEMGAMDSARKSMRELGYSREDSKDMLRIVGNTTKLKGKQNIRLCEYLLEKSEDEMLRTLEGQNYKIALTLPQNATVGAAKRKIFMFKERLQKKYSNVPEMNSKVRTLINTFHKLLKE